MRDVGIAVADVAEPILAGQLGLDLLADRGAEPRPDRPHGDARPAADVDRAAVGAVCLQRESERARHVAHGDEVAPLETVLVHARRAIVEEARGEDREHAGVRVRERLAGSVRVEEAKRDRRDAVGGAGDEARALLARTSSGRRSTTAPSRFVSGVGAGSRPGQLPLAPVELLARPLRRLDPIPGRRAIQALAVHAHARGDEQLANRRLRRAPRAAPPSRDCSTAV